MYISGDRVGRYSQWGTFAEAAPALGRTSFYPYKKMGEELVKSRANKLVSIPTAHFAPRCLPSPEVPDVIGSVVLILAR